MKLSLELVAFLREAVVFVGRTKFVDAVLHHFEAILIGNLIDSVDFVHECYLLVEDLVGNRVWRSPRSWNTAISMASSRRWAGATDVLQYYN